MKPRLKEPLDRKLPFEGREFSRYLESGGVV